ncbi:MAG: protein arginine kinase [Clostridiales bacterium]|jgi:protein arginine kinase|nr:protein arginine kinase [Clostridiales bacterium]
MSVLKWYESAASDDHIIISSRVRLARNLKKYPFPTLLSDEAARHLIRDIEGAVENDGFLRVDLATMPAAERQCLLENHLISPEFLGKQGAKGFFTKEDESVGLMINEEDHLRIQTILPGDNIKESYLTADRIDNVIENSLEYAFDKEFGYLTACPTNAGTGMRVSLMFHIPALEMTGHLMHVMNSIAKFGMTVRGLYGEGSKPLGSIYQISNQLTIGKSESEIISILNNTAAKIIEQEETLRDKLFSDQSLALENRIYRSYGILSYCKKISAKEAMPMLSDLRLGFNANVLDLPRPKLPVYQMMMHIQPGNLEKRMGVKGTEIEQDVFRASYIQGCLKN